MMDREERQLEPVRHAGFVEDAGQVVLNRVLADRELLREVFVRVAGDHQRENLPLACGGEPAITIVQARMGCG